MIGILYKTSIPKAKKILREVMFCDIDCDTIFIKYSTKHNLHGLCLNGIVCAEPVSIGLVQYATTYVRFPEGEIND